MNGKGCFERHWVPAFAGTTVGGAWGARGTLTGMTLGGTWGWRWEARGDDVGRHVGMTLGGTWG